MMQFVISRILFERIVRPCLRFSRGRRCQGRFMLLDHMLEIGEVGSRGAPSIMKRRLV